MPEPLSGALGRRPAHPRAGNTAPPAAIRHLVEAEEEPPAEPRPRGWGGGWGGGGGGAGGGGGVEMSNPIATERKRNGFLVACDVTQAPGSLGAAMELVDRIFDRLLFNRDDPIRCPVAVVIVGCKSDLRASTPGLPTEAQMRHLVQARRARSCAAAPVPASDPTPPPPCP